MILSFLICIEDGYRDNPYHSRQVAKGSELGLTDATVLRSVRVLMCGTRRTHLNAFDPLELQDPCR